MVDRVKHAMSALVIVQGNILLLFSPNQKLKKKKKKNRIVEKGLDIATVQECWPLVPERDWIKQCVTAR